MKFLPVILFGFAALAQWAAPCWQIWTYEQVLTKGTLIKLKCAAPDPYDLWRGRFLAVQPAQSQVAAPLGLSLERGQPFFATFTTGPDGLATISGVSLTPPVGGDYIRLTAGFVYDQTVTIEWPFERFYLNEKLAPEADRWFAESIRTDGGIVAEVRVDNGRAVLADLSVEGRPIREILKQRLE